MWEKDSICCTLSLLFLFGINNYREKINENSRPLQFCKVFITRERWIKYENKLDAVRQIQMLCTVPWFIIQLTHKNNTSCAYWKVAFFFFFFAWIARRSLGNFGWQLFVVHWMSFTNSAVTDSDKNYVLSTCMLTNTWWAGKMSRRMEGKIR